MYDEKAALQALSMKQLIAKKEWLAGMLSQNTGGPRVSQYLRDVKSEIASRIGNK